MLVAFDMFGTLADTAGVISELAPVCGDRASQVALAWRGKQLEYMFRVTAMGQFPPFGELTQWGLAAALAESGLSLPGSQLRTLASAYQRLRPFDDARPALAGLHQSGHTIVVFSVGPRSWLEELTSSYREFVDALVSAEDAGVYKPHPGIYQHLLATMKTGPGHAAGVLQPLRPHRGQRGRAAHRMVQAPAVRLLTPGGHHPIT
jgi:2-haloacid dehalogenase